MSKKIKRIKKLFVEKFYDRAMAEIFITTGYGMMPNIVSFMMPRFGFTAQEQLLVYKVIECKGYRATNEYLASQMGVSINWVKKIKRRLKDRQYNGVSLIETCSIYNKETNKREITRYDLRPLFMTSIDHYDEFKRIAIEKAAAKNICKKSSRDTIISSRDTIVPNNKNIYTIRVLTEVRTMDSESSSKEILVESPEEMIDTILKVYDCNRASLGKGALARMKKAGKEMMGSNYIMYSYADQIILEGEGDLGSSLLAAQDFCNSANVNVHVSKRHPGWVPV